MNFLRKIHMPVAFYLLLVSVVLSLATGYGVPYRQLIEGEFGYLNIVVVILTGVMFLRVYEASGAIDLLMHGAALYTWYVYRFRSSSRVDHWRAGLSIADRNGLRS